MDNPHNMSESVPDPPSQDPALPTTTQSCDTCGKSFRLQDDLDAHLVRDHDNVDVASFVSPGSTAAINVTYCSQLTKISQSMYR